MHENEWQVQINNFEYKLESQVFIYRISRDIVEYLEISSPQVIVRSFPRVQDASEGGVKPTFVCRQDEAISIAKAFVAYANSQGFKNGDETFNKGKLEATENHLADMRALVFKKPTIFSTTTPSFKKEDD